MGAGGSTGANGSAGAIAYAGSGDNEFACAGDGAIAGGGTREK